MVRQTDEIYIRIVDLDIFSERSPMSKARLKLMVANLLITERALFARAAAAHERKSDAVAAPPVFNVAAHISNNT